MKEGKIEFVRHSDPEEEEEEFSEDQNVDGVFCVNCEAMIVFKIGDNIERCVMEFANLHSCHGEVALLSADDDEKNGYHTIAVMIKTN
jgi:hypothetical protein